MVTEEGDERRPFTKTREGDIEVEFHTLCTVSNEDLISCIRKMDLEIADEVENRFSYYFKELDYLWEVLETQKQLNEKL